MVIVQASEGGLIPLCEEASDAAAARRPPQENHWELLGRFKKSRQKEEPSVFISRPAFLCGVVPHEGVTVCWSLSGHLACVREAIPKARISQDGKSARSSVTTPSLYNRRLMGGTCVSLFLKTYLLGFSVTCCVNRAQVLAGPGGQLGCQELTLCQQERTGYGCHPARGGHLLPSGVSPPRSDSWLRGWAWDSEGPLEPGVVPVCLGLILFLSGNTGGGLSSEHAVMALGCEKVEKPRWAGATACGHYQKPKATEPQPVV